MPKTYRPSLAVFVLLLVAVLAAPAHAADSVSTARQKRDQTRQKRAQLAAQINTLRASDRQLEAAVKALDRQVSAQQASADAAAQAEQAARAAQNAAEARLRATEDEIAGLHATVVNRAVAAYIRPQESPLTGVFTAKSLDDASRKNSILAQVTSVNTDSIDQLRAARQDRAEEQRATAAARALAAERQRVVTEKLAAVKKAQAEQLRLASALRARIAGYEAESREMAAAESRLSALIQQRESASRASRGGADPGTDGRVSGAGLIWPLRAPVTSEFGPRWGGFHPGIDIAGPNGSPIRAAKAGSVIVAGWEGGYGNYTCISHGGGFSTCYGHQSRIAVSEGQSVSQGQVIGYEGSTGHSTGPHLHFETRVNGSPQNPRRYLP